MYPTSSPGKSPGDEVDMYPTPEQRNVWNVFFGLWSVEKRSVEKTGAKFHNNQSQTNNWSFTEKNHEGSQTGLPKDVLWKSCKVKTYLVRSALQIYFTTKHKRSPSSVQVHVLVDYYSLMRLVSESILILWRHRLRVSSWTKRGVSLKEERTYWQFIV